MGGKVKTTSQEMLQWELWPQVNINTQIKLLTGETTNDHLKPVVHDDVMDLHATVFPIRFHLFKIQKCPKSEMTSSSLLK